MDAAIEPPATAMAGMMQDKTNAIRQFLESATLLATPRPLPRPAHLTYATMNYSGALARIDQLTTIELTPVYWHVSDKEGLISVLEPS